MKSLTRNLCIVLDGKQPGADLGTALRWMLEDGSGIYMDNLIKSLTEVEQTLKNEADTKHFNYVDKQLEQGVGASNE